jgi:hypothetical protein
MFVGHYGAAFAAKRAEPRLPLWVWFVAVQWLDVGWSLLVLLGVEKLNIVPGYTEANALDLYYMPYTHGLPGALALSLAFGANVAECVCERRARAFLVGAAASFSHWILDLVVHTPDLPLYDNTHKVGLGLWRHVAVSFPLELAVLAIGVALYTRRTIVWGFAVALAAIQVYANFGPPPASPQVMAAMALAIYVVLAVAAAIVERIARSSG